VLSFMASTSRWQIVHRRFENDYTAKLHDSAAPYVLFAVEIGTHTAESALHAATVPELAATRRLGAAERETRRQCYNTPMPTNPPPKPRRFRKLRIAWSVSWGVVAVLLLALWVRSYWRCDSIATPFASGGLSLHSVVGRCLIEFCIPNSDETLIYGIHSTEAAQDDDFRDLKFPGPLGGFEFVSSPDNTWAIIPHWFLVAGAAALMGVPWLRMHFNLRTLFIATTLLAVLLGILVWHAHE
jgi:hypothetical protein